jgi:2-polyprenyl-3-methyl-5-hydroxy-6-metoxy-1,4-benzoquinol methylase
VLYKLKVRAFKVSRLNVLWRHLCARLGRPPGQYGRLDDYIRQLAPGKSFVDIGCMWGVNGAHAFLAEASGATAVCGVDVFGPTPEFEAERARRGSHVEFVLGDCTAPVTIERVGPHDVVFCAGVLYHHPSPFDVLVALRSICRERLLLRTSTIPEVNGLPNAAVFFPYLPDRSRRLWDLRALGLLHQAGISQAFRPEDGYGNWFWGLTPSCLESMLTTAGFRVLRRDHEPFAQTVLCEPIATPFAHRLPDPREARSLAGAISASGVARPA